MNAVEATAIARRRLAMVQSLIELAADRDIPLAEYLRQYLPDHVRAAGPDGWMLLSHHPAVLQQLDPNAVAIAAVRTDFGERGIPGPVAAIVGARHQLMSAPLSDRSGLGQIAEARFGGPGPARLGVEGGSWSVRNAWLNHRPAHLVLTAGDRGIRSLATYLDIDGALRILAGTSAGITQIWDPVTGVLLGELSGHAGAVRAIVTRQDAHGRFIATAGNDGLVMLWDPTRRVRTAAVETGTQLWAMVLAGVDPDLRLVAGGRDGSLRVWDLDLMVRPPLARMTAWVTAIASLGDLLAVGDDAGEVRLYDISRGETVWRVSRPGLGVRALTVTPDHAGLRLLVVFEDAQTWLLGPDGELIAELAPHRARTAASLAFGQQSLFGIADGHDLVLTSVDSLQEVARLTGHTGDIRAAVALPAGSGSLVLATGAKDGTVRCWFPPSAFPTADPELGPVRSLLDLAFAPSPMLVAGGADGRLHWLPTGAGKTVAISVPVARGPVSLAVSAGSAPPTLYFASKGAPNERIHGDLRFVDGPRWAGAPVVATDSGGTVYRALPDSSVDSRVTAATVDEVVARTWLLPEPVELLVGRGTDEGFAAVAADYVWDLWGLPASAGQQAVRLHQAAGPVTALLGLPGGVAYGCGRDVVILEFQRFEPVVVRLLPAAHDDTVRALCLVPGGPTGPRMVSGDSGGRLVVVDPQTGDGAIRIEIGLPVLALTAHDAGIAVGTSEGVLVIDLETGDRPRDERLVRDPSDSSTQRSERLTW